MLHFNIQINNPLLPIANNPQIPRQRCAHPKLQCIGNAKLVTINTSLIRMEIRLHPHPLILRNMERLKSFIPQIRGLRMVNDEFYGFPTFSRILHPQCLEFFDYRLQLPLGWLARLHVFWALAEGPPGNRNQESSTPHPPRDIQLVEHATAQFSGIVATAYRLSVLPNGSRQHVGDADQEQAMAPRCRVKPCVLRHLSIAALKAMHSQTSSLRRLILRLTSWTLPYSPEWHRPHPQTQLHQLLRDRASPQRLFLDQRRPHRRNRPDR